VHAPGRTHERHHATPRRCLVRQLFGRPPQPINQRIHVIAVPMILWTVVALLWCVPAGASWFRSGIWPRWRCSPPGLVQPALAPARHGMLAFFFFPPACAGCWSSASAWAGCGAGAGPVRRGLGGAVRRPCDRRPAAELPHRPDLSAGRAAVGVAKAYRALGWRT
jgi:hypothetical protein